jgi:hypothetical protein
MNHPTITGTCLKCKEPTSLDEQCCDAGVYADGHNYPSNSQMEADAEAYAERVASGEFPTIQEQLEQAWKLK